MGLDVVSLAICHRLRAFADTTGQIGDRMSFVAGELRCVPLRPFVGRAARRRASSPAEEWQRLGGRMGPGFKGSSQHRLVELSLDPPIGR